MPSLQKTKKYNHEYYLKYKKQGVLKRKEYYKKNRAKCLAWSREWQKNHKDNVRKNKNNWKFNHFVLTDRKINSAVRVFQKIEEMGLKKSVHNSKLDMQT